MRSFLIALLPCFCLLVGSSYAQTELVPLPRVARVVDQVGILSQEDKGKLELALQNLETQKGSQGAVVILPSTQPEAIEQFSIRLAEAWKLGREKVDDGFIFIVASNDRRMRLEVGYGLEGVIPDARAKQLIETYAVPAFREGKFSQGIVATIDAATRLVQGEPLPPPSSEPMFVDRMMAFAVFFLFFTPFFTPRYAMVIGGVLGGIGGWVIGSTILLALVGVVVGALAALCLSVSKAAPSYRGRSGGLSGGSFGGGFRGGGGSFGGGGASGSW